MSGYNENREGDDPDRDLRDDPEQFVDFFENASVPMHWVGPDGTVLHVNQAELDALGYAREEYVGRHIADFHADRATIDDILSRLTAGEELRDYPARMQRKDGSIRHVLINSSVNWTDGEFTNTRCVTRDVTDRKERKRELRRKNDRLEEFASIVSHDLRSPLAVAEGRVELASEESDSEHLEPALDAIRRCEELIEDLLALAREGREVDAVERVCLSEVVENSWEAVETGTATLDIETDRVIRADSSRLQQLTENLVRNAVEHGGEDVTVTVDELDDERGFYVGDDGPGIPAEERDRVFESGYSTSESGTGFGLSIVEEIAEAHGWDVRASDSAGGGARFEITGVETE